MSVTADRYHDISVGHRVHGHESKCRHLHGHNYRVHFKVEADIQGKLNALHDPEGLCHSASRLAVDSIGRVMDFSVIKEKLCMWLEENWDHKFLAWTDDAIMSEATGLMDTYGESLGYQLFGESIVFVPFNPTAENMAEYLVEVIGPQQLAGTGVKLVSVCIEETRKCSVNYTL